MDSHTWIDPVTLKRLEVRLDGFYFLNNEGQMVRWGDWKDEAREFLRLAERVQVLEGNWVDATNEKLELVARVAALEEAYDKLLAEAKDDAHRAEVARNLAADRIKDLEEELDQWKNSAIAERDLGNLERKGAEAVGRRLGELEEENRQLLAGKFPEVATRIQALEEENARLRAVLASMPGDCDPAAYANLKIGPKGWEPKG